MSQDAGKGLQGELSQDQAPIANQALPCRQQERLTCQAGTPSGAFPEATRLLSSWLPSLHTYADLIKSCQQEQEKTFLRSSQTMALCSPIFLSLTIQQNFQGWISRV